MNPEGNEAPGAAAPSPSRPPRISPELRRRIQTAFILLPIILVLVVAGGVPFLILIAALIAGGIEEFNRIMQTRGYAPVRRVTPLLGAGLAVVAFCSNEYYLTLLLTFAILLVLMTQLTHREISKAITGMSVSITSILYVGWLLSHTILVRNLGISLGGRPEVSAVLASSPITLDVGLFLTIMILACVFLNDTGAYFVGRKWGRHKLAPTISPKKTWEGFFGGLATCLGTACLVNLIFRSDLGYGNALVVGFLVGVFGTLGDLVESLIKRDAQIKDSGTLFPGHGGILDRLDSILFSFPIVYYYAKIIF